MDLKEKVTEALRLSLHPDHIELEDDDGISGVVVSAEFQTMSSLDRQKIIDGALRHTSVRLSKSEMRNILAIAGLTPAEYEAIGSEATNGR